MKLVEGVAFSELHPRTDPTADVGYYRYQVPNHSPEALTIFVPHEIASWGTTAKQQIRSLWDLPEGWDGADSPSMDPTTIDIACQLIDLLASEIPRLREPTVTPTPYGGVFVEWYSEEQNVSFTIERGGISDYVSLCFCDLNAGLDWEGSLIAAENHEWVRVLGSFETTR